MYANSHANVFFVIHLYTFSRAMSDTRLCCSKNNKIFKTDVIFVRIKRYFNNPTGFVFHFLWYGNNVMHSKNIHVIYFRVQHKYIIYLTFLQVYLQHVLFAVHNYNVKKFIIHRHIVLRLFLEKRYNDK